VAIVFDSEKSARNVAERGLR